MWVLDNASNDGSVEYLKNKFPQTEIVSNDKNVGFAQGHNLILEKITTKYVLILNSDTEVSDGVLDNMYKFMEQNPQVGIASCKILGFDNRLQPNGGDLPFGIALVSWLLNLESFFKNLPNFHRQESDYYQQIHEVGWVSGNFMIARVDVLRSVGLFAKDYFMYFEDVDLCFKVRKAGYKVMINPQLSIRHLSGGSADDPKFRQWAGEYKGLLTFYKNHYGEGVSLLLKLVIQLTTILRIIAFAIVGKFDYSKTYVKVISNI